MTTKDKELLKLSLAARAHYRIYRSNAATRKIPWRLTPAEAQSIFSSNCHWCGALPSPRRFSTRNKRPYADNLSGIDRVDPKGTYEPSNVVPACIECNKGKQMLGKDAFLAMCRRVTAKHGC